MPSPGLVSRGCRASGASSIPIGRTLSERTLHNHRARKLLGLVCPRAPRHRTMMVVARTLLGLVWPRAPRHRTMMVAFGLASGRLAFRGLRTTWPARLDGGVCRLVWHRIDLRALLFSSFLLLLFVPTFSFSFFLLFLVLMFYTFSCVIQNLQNKFIIIILCITFCRTNFMYNTLCITFLRKLTFMYNVLCITF